jgi:hypothetical protein
VAMPTNDGFLQRLKSCGKSHCFIGFWDVWPVEG